MRIILRLSWIEFFLRSLPEEFIIAWGIYVISRKPFNILNIMFSTIALAIASFFVRWLPIYFGVHMIIDLILFISIMAITEIPIIKSIYGSLLMYSMLSLGEFLNMILLDSLNIDTGIAFLNPVKKCFYGIPSLMFLALCIIIFNYVLKKKEGRNYVSNRKNSS